VLHDLWQPAADIRAPLICGAIVITLFVLRIPGVRRLAKRLCARLERGASHVNAPYP
jgi:DMSO/TMAO reductase YedYZ heme-binding membrane subunit